MKIVKVVEINDLIIQSDVSFNIFRGFTLTEGQNFSFPVDFVGHCYNSAAATTQPVIILADLVRTAK